MSECEAESPCIVELPLHSHALLHSIMIYFVGNVKEFMEYKYFSKAVYSLSLTCKDSVAVCVCV